MIKLTQFFTVASLCLATVLPLRAQTTQTEPESQPANASPSRAHRQGLIRQLGLSRAQLKQMREIKKTMPKGKERRAAMAAVLTPAQRTQLQALRGQRHRNAAPAQNTETNETN